MPFLLWPLIAAGLGGAFVGAQIDDRNDPVPNAFATFNIPSTGKILAFGAVAIGAYVVYKKVIKG